MEGLPAAVLSLPLELAVLCNSIVFCINVTGGFTDNDEKAIHQGLVRVLEASGPIRVELSCVELWQRILQDVKSEELDPSLHQLAGLQGALWLSSDHIHDVVALFQLLNNTRGPSVNFCSAENDLLELLKSWQVPEEGRFAYLMAESTQRLKDLMCTAAAFQQGLQRMEAGNPLAAVGILQEAAAGLCSTRVLAQIFTALGYCYQQMDRPQSALQCWKQALQADFQCLPALYLASVLYRQMGKTYAELESLRLLYEALGDSEQEVSSSSHVSLLQIELLLQISSMSTVFCSHNRLEVKYLMAKRHLEVGRVEEAVEHYLDLLALLHEGSHQQVFLSSLPILPRIPDVYLETASALLQRKRFQDALTMCEEVIEKTKDLIPERLNIQWHSGGQSAGGAHDNIQSSLAGTESGLHSTHLEDIPGLGEQARESLRCILWAATALLFQGQAMARLQEWKDSITHFSRCINLLLNVQIVETDMSVPDTKEAKGDAPRDVKLLQSLKAGALVGRGVQFLELGKEKEALMNLQLCLQVSPGHREAAFHLINVLWKLDRKQEAACYWQKFQSTSPLTDGQQEAAYRYLPLHLLPHLKECIPGEEMLKRKIEDYLQSNPKDSWHDSCPP